MQTSCSLNKSLRISTLRNLVHSCLLPKQIRLLIFYQVFKSGFLSISELVDMSYIYCLTSIMEPLMLLGRFTCYSSVEQSNQSKFLSFGILLAVKLGLYYTSMHEYNIMFKFNESFILNSFKALPILVQYKLNQCFKIQINLGAIPKFFSLFFILIQLLCLPYQATLFNPNKPTSQYQPSLQQQYVLTIQNTKHKRQVKLLFMGYFYQYQSSEQPLQSKQ